MTFRFPKDPFHFQNDSARPRFSALAPVVGLLVAAAFAKLGAATQLFHLTH
jgi:hypothetical protein